MEAQETHINCPVCGGAAPSTLKYSKVLICPHCTTTLFLEDAAVKQAGVKSVLTEVPSILELGRRFVYRSWMFETLGRIRYDYGDGFWDEWWVMLDSGKDRWVSVDEGDIAIQTPFALEEEPPVFENLRVGQSIKLGGRPLKVTEVNEGKCIGMEGELPEIVFPGDVHQYAHFSGARGFLVTGEYSDGTSRFFQGAWVDPFELRPL